MKSSRFNSRSACASTSAGGFASSSRVRRIARSVRPRPCRLRPARAGSPSFVRANKRGVAHRKIATAHLSAASAGSARSRVARRCCVCTARTRFSKSSSSRIACFCATRSIEIRREKIGQLLRIVDVANNRGACSGISGRKFDRSRGAIAQILKLGLPFLALRRHDGVRADRFPRADRAASRQFCASQIAAAPARR